MILDKPVKTQFVILKLTGLLSVSMEREKVQYRILEEKLLLWGTRIPAPTVDRTYSRDVAMEYDVPKKHKAEWEVGVMEEGEHPFPFEIELPTKSIPSTIHVPTTFSVFAHLSLEKAQLITPFSVFTNDRRRSWALYGIGR